ncbi:MAG TPA: hypothetical protein VEN81_17440 [Planctomycetota bacterium]|nr:hypothetical protein [Planctomycetota bacterium]
MRTSVIAFTPGLVLALALGAAAQDRPVTTNKDNKDTLHVSISGTVDLDYVWRSQEITGFTDSAQAEPGPGPAGSHSENTFEGYLAVRMDVDLNDKVSAVIEFGTKRVDNGEILTWGGTGANTIFLREARVNVGDFLTQGLKLGAGISDWTFDVRGRGNSFAFDPRHSEPFGHNMSTVQDGAGTLGNRAGFPQELEPVGFWLSWTHNQLIIELVALPAVIEGGPVTADESLYAFDLWYLMDSIGKGSKIGAILALDHAEAMSNAGFVGSATSAPIAGTHMDVATIGGGADLRMMDGALELFGEVYFQFGYGGSNGAVPIPGTPGAGSSARAGGYAFNFGAQYTIPNNPVWLGAGFNYLSGDGNSNAGTDKKVSSFMSYGSVKDLMILEDMYYGFNWDTNYWAFKLNGGFALSIASGDKNLKIDGILGIARTAQTVAFAPGTTTHGLGDEVDVKATWVLTKQASLHAGLAFLFSSEVLKDSMAAIPGSDPKNHAIEYVLGAELKF